MSPYVYCAGNPVIYVNLNGRDWITASYEDNTFVFYDERVNSAEDITSVYYYKDGEGGRNSYDIKYVGKRGSFNRDGKSYLFNKDGSYSIDGVIQDGEYDNEGLHIGSSSEITELEALSSENWYGNYLGPNNPKITINNNQRDSYIIPPIEALDYAAFKHDKGYDAVNAVGIYGALIKKNNLFSDLKLVYDCLSLNGTDSKNQTLWRIGTSVIFTLISEEKLARTIFGLH